ncbi:MAG: glycoside hydrolase family 2 protein, partial [Bacillota bacterium]
VEAIGNGTSGELKISTDNYARVVSIDVDLDLSDNYFDLLPGETKVVRWSVPHGTSVSAEGVPEISVTCWNAAR